MQFDVVLRTFSGFFDQEGIRYVVIGGVAVTAWGRVRSTFDLDFAVHGDNAARVVTFAESLGYETLYVSAGFSNHLHADRAMGRVDFTYMRGRTAEEVLKSATLKPLVDDRDLPVASPEHLAMMKGLAMKNNPERMRYEGEDVRVLLNVEGVDRDAVREYYHRLGLLEYFDAIVKSR